MAKAKLNYSIVLRRLWGDVGEEEVSISAVSGGRAGSTARGAVDDSTANNPLRIGQKTDHAKGIHGGPLPIGNYKLLKPKRHPHLGLSAQLVPQAGGFTLGMFGRGGFYIHGRGPHGSDGCIVPSTAQEFQQLMRLLEKSEGGELTVYP